MLTDCTSVSVALTSWYEGVHEVSSNDPMVILFRVRTCHVPKEADLPKSRNENA